MSSYDTVDRRDNWWVRTYSEHPIDLRDAIFVEVKSPYIDPDEAIRFATALLNAARRAKDAAKVDEVIG